ncbi:MAG: MBL fold metallo-hydrolase [Ruminococcaceae bacterium]|jgi:glyoxylase-like metal-dependent hydrolase (beta-lactamase superfamily II)|nr:MBL fold metallo-hydrolase [Oscillospiraceae bacterium]
MNPVISNLRPDTFRIDDGGVRFFLLCGTERALLADSGMTVKNAREIAEGLTSLPVSLLNTHADQDHTGSNDEFDEVMMHPDEEPLYRKNGYENRVVPVRGGDMIDLGERLLEVVDLPGHTPGSIGLLDRKMRVLISGDPIQQNGNVFMFGSHRDLRLYIESLKNLLPRLGEIDEIWPSHADLPVSPAVVPRLIEGAEKILRGELTGDHVEMHGRSIHRVDLGVTGMLVE